MTGLLPASLASFLNSHNLVFLSEVVGAIAVSFLLLLLGTREVVRGRLGGETGEQRRHLLNAISLTLSIVVAVVIVERFLLLK